jgi:hypothetical protein
MIFIIWLVFIILFVIWNEWDVRRRKKQDWKELETSSRIINKAEMDKLAKEAKRYEYYALHNYKFTKRKGEK